MFAVTQHAKEHKELNTRERRGQSTTKMTSASADSRNKSSWKMMSLWWEHCVCAWFSWPFSSVFHPLSPSFAIMSSSAPNDFRRVNRWTRNAEERRENFYYEALAFLPAQHQPGVWWGEYEARKIYKGARKRKHRWEFVDGTRNQLAKMTILISPSSNRVSDFAGADRMKTGSRWRGDMPPPWPHRFASPRIREDQALQKFYSKWDKMHRATSDDDFSQAWCDYGRSVFPQSNRKTGTNVELFNVPTYQVQHSFQQYGFLQPEEWIPETREPEQAHCQRWKVQFNRFVTCPRILGNSQRDYDSRGWQSNDRHKTVAWRLRLGGMAL